MLLCCDKGIDDLLGNLFWGVSKPVMTPYARSAVDLPPDPPAIAILTMFGESGHGQDSCTFSVDVVATGELVLAPNQL